jgi:hypothetical protein
MPIALATPVVRPGFACDDDAGGAVVLREGGREQVCRRGRHVEPPSHARRDNSNLAADETAKSALRAGLSSARPSRAK